jgi:hypothetical protein
MKTAAFRKFALVPLAIALVCLGIASSRAQSPAQPINLSTRMQVQTGDNVGIAGVIFSGTAPKHVLIRAIGPSLSQMGVSDALADPTLELYDSRGVLLFSNDNWKDNPTQRAFIEADGLPPENDLESAIDWTFFFPNSFTAIVRGKGNTTGVGLIEVYDLNPSADSKLANIGTRAFVDTGNNIVIAGFVLGNNSGEDRIVVRGIGPTLEAPGVADALQDPTLELRNSNGTVLLANDNWQDDATQAAELQGAGLEPANRFESGIVASLLPGSYTALLAGLKNSTGVGLVEVYDLGTPPVGPPNATVTRIQAGTSNLREKQHVEFVHPPFSDTFRISVYKPSIINNSDIGARAALQGQTAPIAFTASAAEISEAIQAIAKSYFAYGQFGNLELDHGSFSYFASVGAINREPVVFLDQPNGVAAGGFTIEFGSLVGDQHFNTWVAGMPLITISIP